MSQVGTWHSRRESLFGCLVVLTGAMSNLSAHAAAGAPLPRCSAGTESFYLARYLKAGADNSSTPPTIALDQVTLPASQGGVYGFQHLDRAKRANANQRWQQCLS